jgi:hypothetical protein
MRMSACCVHFAFNTSASTSTETNPPPPPVTLPMLATQNDGNAQALNRDCESLLQLIMLQARNKDGEPILRRTLTDMRSITAVDRAQA